MNLNLRERISSFYFSSKRIFTVSNKPSRQEYIVMAKVTGLGIIIIGVIGFVVTLIFKLIGI
ncbi:MAG: protein translocase SEC61 complex subunit gamma [archaeon]